MTYILGLKPYPIGRMSIRQIASSVEIHGTIHDSAWNFCADERTSLKMIFGGQGFVL